MSAILTNSPSSDTPPKMYKHAPLDHNKAAIRLVQLLPDLSPGGLIQCTITHHTTDAEYTCLSYRWGAAAPISAIRMNGEVFHVRQNLLDFLHIARQNSKALCTYWIDALCIDQADVAERVHQVAQMGDIYSKAIQVYLWLGASPDLAPALEVFRKFKLALFDGHELAVIYKNHNALENYFCGNEYWERAWIIQEILLARAVVVWADKVPLRFGDLHWNFDRLFFSWRDKSIAHFFLRKGGSVTPELHASKFAEFKAHFQGIDLISLLQQFPDKICEVPRDRIFSLLAMSKFGYRIDVDYNVPDLMIWENVLKYCGPGDYCAPGLIAQALHLDEDVIREFAQHTEQPVCSSCQMGTSATMSDTTRTFGQPQSVDSDHHEEGDLFCLRVGFKPLK